PVAGSVPDDAGHFGRGAPSGPSARGPVVRTRCTAGSGRERARPGCTATHDTAGRRGSPGYDPFAGLLLAGDRRSPANASKRGILSLPPPQTPTCRLGTIESLSPRPSRNE